jgi:hypothetical protein
MRRRKIENRGLYLSFIILESNDQGQLHLESERQLELALHFKLFEFKSERARLSDASSIHAPGPGHECRPHRRSDGLLWVMMIQRLYLP